MNEVVKTTLYSDEAIRTELFMKFITGLRVIQKEVYKTSADNGFHEKPDNPAEKIALMHSELSEALEVLRKDPDGLSEKIPPCKAIEEELADCIIRILDFAETYKLNIANAIIEKARYNTTRSYKHGKKF